MMKKLFYLALAALVLTACDGNNSGGNDPKQGAAYTFNTATFTLTFSGKGLAIPNGKEGKMPEWHKYKDIAYNIVIEDGVTAIGDYAFQGFTNLTDVQIANSVRRIGKYAFSGCTDLKKIPMPDDLEVIADGAFYKDIALQAPTFPHDLDSLGADCFGLCRFTTIDLSNTHLAAVPARCFYQCPNLTTVVLPTMVHNIGAQAFAECPMLKKVQAKDHSDETGLQYMTLYSIGKEAFYECPKLETVTFPESLRTLGEKAFGRCEALYSFRLAQSSELSEIGDSTFIECTALRVAILNKQYTDIPAGMLRGCTSLTLVENEENLQSIGDYAFQGCSALAEFDWSESLRTVGEYAFASCKKLIDIKLYSQVRTVGKGAFGGCAEAGRLTITSEYLERIEADTFYQLYDITSVSLPATLKYVGKDAFAYCMSLKDVRCNAVTPPEIASSGAFPKVSGNTLHVPGGTKAAYEASGWKSYFSNIVVSNE